MPFDWSGFLGNSAAEAGTGNMFQPHVVSVTQRGGASAAPAASPGQDAQLARAASSAYNQARTDSLARRDKMLGLAQQFGASQLNNSQNLYNQEIAQQGNSLNSRGLSNSTVVDSLRQGAGQAMFQRNAGVGEQQAQMQLGVLGQVQEQYPDMNTLASLFSQPRSGSSTAALAQLFSGMNAGNASGVAGGGGAGSGGSASILRGR